MLERAMSRGRLAQAYLFVGPEGVGKSRFAMHLAQALLCPNRPAESLDACGSCAHCRPFVAGNHPDFHRIGRPEGKRELPIELLIGPRENRGQQGLCHDLSISPTPGSRKIALIDDADSLNEESANALLKTLEEPPAGALLVLIASNLDAVLPTIRSRCQLLRFAPLATADVAAILLEQGSATSTTEAEFAASLSEGSLANARRLLEPGLRALRTTMYGQFAQPQWSGLTLSKQIQAGLESISDELPKQREQAQWVLRFAVAFFQDALRVVSQSGPVAEPLAASEAAKWVSRFSPHDPRTIDRLAALMDRVAEGVGHIDQFVGLSLALDSTFDDLARLMRVA